MIFEVSGTVPDESKVKVRKTFETDETKYSSFKKLLGVTAYVNRFINYIKNKRKIDNELTVNEINRAELMRIKYVQGKHYLSNKQQLNKKQRQSQLNPKIYQDGIIRLHGRFINADLPEYAKLPILQPRQEHFSKLLIQDMHHKIRHCGVSQTPAQIRQRYWIPQGQTAVKIMLKRCLICLRFQGAPYKVKPMAPWPTSKVIRTKTFTNTDLDYFGPLHIRQGKDWVKPWVYLFTCITVRETHLELVEDMSALHRYVARRSKPGQIILDNAPNFKGTKNEVDMAWEKVVDDPSVHSYLSDLRIKWSFIIELSPWMGVFYKRLVGITKMSLRKGIGMVSLTSSQLQTILTKIEELIKTRPLVYVDNNLENQIIPLAHFLSLNIKTGTPVLTVKNEMKKLIPLIMLKR